MKMKRRIILAGIVLLCGLIALLLLNYIENSRYGLEGVYYATPNFQGNPLTTKKDQTPFLAGEPGDRHLPASVFSVVWKGWILIEQAGTHGFATNSDDGSTLKIDGKSVVENGGIHGLSRANGDIALERGLHEIEIAYAQYGGFCVMQAFWTPPNHAERPLPKDILFAARPQAWELFLRAALRRGMPIMIALNVLYFLALGAWGGALAAQQHVHFMRMARNIRFALQKAVQPIQRGLNSARWEEPRFIYFMLFAAYGLFSGARLLEFSLVKEPFIWGDEYVYRILSYRYWTTGDFYASSDAIHQGVKTMPNLLYPFLISAFSAFQSSFFFLIKLFNVLVMNAAIYPFFLVIKQFASLKEAFWLSALLLLMPWMNVGNFVMVEPLFFPLFWLAFYFCHAFFVAPTLKKAMIAGGTIALAYVTKPTGMGILLACFGVMLLVIIRKNMTMNERLRIVCLSGVMAFTSVIGVLVINFLLKGKLDLGLGFYQIYAKGMAKNSFLHSLLGSKDALFMVITHLSLMFFLYLLPLVVACSALIHARKQTDQRASVFLALGLLLGVIFLGTTIKFTLGLEVEAELGRLHTRYHFLTFPFYVMAFAIFLKSISWPRPARIIFGVLWLGTLACNYVVFLPKFAYLNGYPMIVDNMEYSWVFVTKETPSVVILIALLNLTAGVYYLLSTQRKRYPYLLFFMAFCLVANYYQIRFMMRAGHSTKKFNAYKTFLAAHIPHFNSKVVFIENFWKRDPYKAYTNLSHILFWLPYDVLKHQDKAEGSKLKERELPKETEFVVLSGEYVLDLPYQEKWTQDNYTILKR